jgi:acyl CoA:acetate/3-ketoacid CoA transferase alpha subunit
MLSVAMFASGGKSSGMRLFSNRPLSKLVGSAKEALEGIDLKGAVIAVGGFGTGGNPETLLNELSAMPQAQDLVVASLTGGIDGFGIGKLLEAAKVKRLISSYVGENKFLEQVSLWSRELV